MAYIGFSYIAGLFFASFFYLGSTFCALGLLTAGAVLFLCGRRKYIEIYVCIVAFSVGTALYCGYNAAVYVPTVDYSAEHVTLEGTVLEFDEYSDDFSRYTVRGRINGSRRATVSCFGETEICRIGDRITVIGTASLPENSFGFNSLEYNKAKGIFLEIDAESVEVTPDGSFSLRRTAHDYREYIMSRMKRYIAYDGFAVVKAVLFGDKSDIDGNRLTEMYRAGIGHMMAVSGSHLAIVCAVFGFLISLLPINKAARFIVLLIPIFAFALLADMTQSVMRAAVMMTLVYGAALFGRRADPLNSLGIALILLTVTNPFAVRDASLILSAAAVAGLSAIAPELINAVEKKHKSSNILRAVIYAFSASAAVLPFSVMYFSEVSLVSPITSVLLVPLCTIILFCGAVVAFTGGVGFIALPLMKLCGLCCKALTALCGLLGSTGALCVPTGYSSVRIAVLAAVLICAAVLLVTRSAKKTSVTAVIAYASIAASVCIFRLIPSEHISAAVIKDGNAAALAVYDKRSASIIDLYDGGGCASVVAEYLRSLGIERIDMLALTVDGNASEPVYKYELELFDVGTVLMPERKYNPDYKACLGEKTEFYLLDNGGTEITLDKYSLTIGDDNMVVISSGGASAVVFDAGKPIPTGNNSAAVGYNGTTAINSDGNRLSALLDEGSGGVLLNFYGGGKISLEVLSYGGCQ